MGSGQVLQQLNDNTGFFVFDDPRYLVMNARVLDGCGINGKHWVFAASISNFEQTLTMTDISSGFQQTYSNSAGAPFSPVTDTNAFDCPPLSFARPEPAAPPQLGPATLINGRFELSITYEELGGNTGSGTSCR